MTLKALCLTALGLFATGAGAEYLALDDAAKQLLKDSASMPVPADPSQAMEPVGDSVEKAKNLKESMERPLPLPAPPAAAAAPASGSPDPATALPAASKDGSKAKARKKRTGGRPKGE